MATLATMFDGPVGVHLVGSVPLGGAEEVFRTVAGVLGDRLRRIPDGETGPRSDWIGWQYPVFSSQPQFEPGPPGASSSYRALPQLRLRSGVAADGMSFDELGYASAAMSSYAIFARLRGEGVVPAHCRFLVSLPTPLAPVSAFVALEHQADLEPVYEAQMAREVERILDAIPHDRARDPVGRPLRVRDARGRDRGLVRRRASGVLERLLRLAARCRRTSSSATTSATAMRSTATSPSRRLKDLVAVANALGDGLDAR